MKKLVSLTLLCVLAGAMSGWAQTKKIKGRIVDENGDPVIGAAVTVKGTTTGAATDLDGNFSIDAPDNGTTLVIKSIGYTQGEIKIPPSGFVTYKMEASAKALKETVVTALGIKREKKAIGYSTSDVSADLMRKSGEQNVIQGLAAKAPGIQVTGSGGSPGASTKIVIRGNSSFTGNNQPLIVIDGVPVDNSTVTPQAADDPYNGNLAGVNQSNRAVDINPEDIESISILKGPAAAALYGARGANGAILYTTKRGKARKGIGITFNTSVSMDEVNKLPKLQNQYVQGSIGGPMNTWNAGPDGVPYTDDDNLGTPNSWGPKASSIGVPTYNNVDNFFKKGWTYDNSLSLYGGNENTSFRAGISNTNQTGIIPNTKLNRTSVRLTGDTKLTDKLTIGATVNYTNTSTIRAQNGSNLSGTMLTLLRTPINYNGDKYVDENGVQIPYYYFYDNAKYSVYYNPYEDETNRVLGNMTVNYEFTKALVLNVRTGVDWYNTTAKQIYSINSMGNDAGDGTGQVNRTSFSNKNLYSDVLLRYNKRMSENFSINALAGYNYTYSQDNSIFSRGRNLSLPNFYNFINASELYTSNEDNYLLTQAVFAELGGDYKGQVYATVTGRKEWSSGFGEGSPGFFYPKADVAWVFTETFNAPKWFSYGKVRAAYANSGNAPGAYLNKTYYAVPFIADGWTNGMSFPYGGQSGYGISSRLIRSGLRPESVTGLEAGLELNFFNSRITFEGTVYRQVSENLLLDKPTAASAGFQVQYTNAGTMENKGIELALGLIPVKSSSFEWKLSGNWAMNRNKVLKLDQGVNQISVETGFADIASYAIVGQPYGVFFGTAWQRDANGNLLIDEASGLPTKATVSQKLGDPNPKWLMGINNEFTYKNLSFSFLWDFRQGGDIWNATWVNLNFRGRSEESGDRERTYVIDGVYDGNASNPGARNSTAISANSYYTNYLGSNGAAENAIQDGGWVRLRAVNLGYRFDLAARNPKYLVKSIDVGLSGRNLLLFTDYKGVDPETSLTGAGSNLNGYDYYNNPGTRSYSMNLRFTF